MPFPIIAAIGALVKPAIGLVKKLKAKKLAKKQGGEIPEGAEDTPLARAAYTPQQQIYQPQNMGPQGAYAGGTMGEFALHAPAPHTQQMPPWLIPAMLGLGGIVVVKSLLSK